MSLFICEKPSQAKDIASVLGVKARKDGYIETPDHQVTWCIGHLLEQDEPDSYDAQFKKWHMDHLPIIPDTWKLHVKKNVAKQYKVVSGLVKNATSIVISTDADREGECIAWEILERLNFKGDLQRLWLSALDPASIKKALAKLKPGSETMPLYHAAVGRQRADWLVGMNMTRAFTLYGRGKGIDGVLSVGRVQTPTLALVVNRDSEIAQFKPVPYYANWIDFQSDNGVIRARIDAPRYRETAEFDVEGRCLSEPIAKAISQKTAGSATVTSAEYKKMTSKPPLGYSLSVLQQTGDKQWGYGAQEVLDIAQALYETHKLTSYPRSDCAYLPMDQFNDSKPILDTLKQAALFSDDVWKLVNSERKSRIWNDKKVTAHHAIIPTGKDPSAVTLSEKENNVFNLICQNYIAQFMPDYEYQKTEITLDASGIVFKVTGQTPIKFGWKALVKSDTAKSDDAAQLPKYDSGDSVLITESGYASKKTNPPKPFTEGTLIAAMSNIQRFVTSADIKRILKETEGIGTEATRASIIETLFNRQFIEKKAKAIRSTQLGKQLIEILPNEVKDPGTTALMEKMLEQIAQSDFTLEEFMARQEKWLTLLIDRVKKDYHGLPKADPTPQIDHGNCPECSHPLRSRQGKFGAFVGCSNYPDCKYIVKQKPSK